MSDDYTAKLAEYLKEHPEILETVTRAHREGKLEAKTPPTPKTEDYGYIVADGIFETFVSWREANNRAAAIQVAYQPLQAWYCHNAFQTGSGCTVRTVTRSQYVDWLRSFE